MVKLFFLCMCMIGTLVQGATVLDILKTRRETTLISLIQAAGLESTLSGTGPFTIFAPTNLAFSHLGYTNLQHLKSDPVALANILKYHVVSGNVMSDDLKVNEKMLDSLAGPKIRINYYMYTNRIAAEGARLTYQNLKATNGIVHVVDKVMMPPNGTIPEILASNSNLATLKSAIDAAGLTTALSDGPYTLLAPNEAAFHRLGDAVVQALLADPELLKSVLLYHVVHGTLYSTGMHSGSLHTLEETDSERLISSFGGRNAQVDGARVITKDVSATNGVVHVIDHVLVPASLRTAVANLAA